MRKSSYAAFMFAVMLVMCIIRWTAQADVADPEIFIRDVPGASFDLTASENALELTITPQTSGDFRYSFVLISGDTKHAEKLDSGYYSYGRSGDITASFVYGVPEEGEVMHYEINASFFPRNATPQVTESDDKPAPESEDKPVPESDDKPVPESGDKPAPESDDKPSSSDNSQTTAESRDKPAVSADNKSSSGGGCSVYYDDFAPHTYSIVRRNYVSANFKASADVHNINGTVYVELHKGE
ncbi:MAG: hypothetical protein IJS28_04775 [Synergistaceae bacterium]|nr:hypothetical protein [Synergistaceae bacterium]